MIVIVIPAKGKSSRLPNKNMTILNGRPIIDYTIDAAKESKRTNLIVVSTDSREIADYVERAGIRVIQRSKELGGEVPLFEVYKHAAEQLGLEQIEYLIGLQVDHPDRTIKVDDALEFFEENKADYLTTTEADDIVNGSYKIYSQEMLQVNNPKKHVVLIDDCTNIHYQSDLDKASENLLRIKKSE